VATSRAAQSPTITWSGAATLPAPIAMPNAVRSYRPRRPRRNAQAYAPASRNPQTMKAAKYMWMYSLQNIGLANSACHGCTSVALPSTSVNPDGWFIQPLTEITNSEPATPATATGIPERKCARGPSRSHP
jgi:hypothetical protein